jgi:GEVED domain
VYQNVEQTPTGFVRNATATAQVATGTAGNYNLAPAAYDAGQAPNEAEDGKLVMAASSTTQGFATPAGHTSLTGSLVTGNNNGTYDTPAGNLNNEPNGVSGGAFFRNGGATPGSLYTVISSAPATPLVYGGTNASFLLESDNADVGDAPISYGNPSHTLSGIRLGASVDADTGLLNNATATGDDANNTDDENGVTLTPLLPNGETTIVPVSIQNGSGFLNAWFDWNADGDFADVGEQMVTNQAVAAGTVNLNIAVPATAIIGPTFARFRVCTNNTVLDNCSSPRNTVQSGEVEDYQFTVSRKLILRKTTLGGVGGAFGFALTNTVQTTGTVTTTVAGTPTTVDGDTAGAATLAYAIVAPTTAVTINENSLPAGWSLTGATCVNASGATVGSLAGSTYTLTGAPVSPAPTPTPGRRR